MPEILREGLGVGDSQKKVRNLVIHGSAVFKPGHSQFWPVWGRPVQACDYDLANGCARLAVLWPGRLKGGQQGSTVHSWVEMAEGSQ